MHKCLALSALLVVLLGAQVASAEATDRYPGAEPAAGTAVRSTPTGGGLAGLFSRGNLARAKQGQMSSEEFTAEWLAAQPDPKPTPDLECLAKALYFEARGEGIRGQAAVAEVILNRTTAPEFPTTICGVVTQGARDGSAGCQFSYACDGRSDKVRDRVAYTTAKRISAAMIAGAERTITDGATYFHNASVRPSWSKRFAKTAVVGRHSFYRAPIRTASN